VELNVWNTNSLKALNVEPPTADQVGVKMVAAPINPADLNQIEGALLASFLPPRLPST
jgi:NADPH:quinone reductase-like Zn-dependent oxidoreductase